MKYLTLIMTLIAIVITPYAYADYTAEYMDKINWQVNQQFDNIPDNCLIVAKEKKRLLLKHGIKAKIVVIQPTFATMKHAVLCVDDQCIDNGDITNNIFNKNELSYFGRVL